MPTNAQIRGYAKRSSNKRWRASRHRVAVLGANVLHKKHKAAYLRGRKVAASKVRRFFENTKNRELRSKQTRKGYTAAVRAQMSASAKVRVARDGCNWRFKNIGAFEKVLYIELHTRGITVHRQFAIPNSRYNGDLFLPEKNLVVEIDLHPSHYTKEGMLRTKVRDGHIKKQKLGVLHITQEDKSKGMYHCIRKIVAY